STHARLLSLSFIVIPHTHTYTHSLHDALPIYEKIHQGPRACDYRRRPRWAVPGRGCGAPSGGRMDRHRGAQSESRRLGLSSAMRSEEHTSELQSQSNIVCRLLLEKKKSTSTHK